MLADPHVVRLFVIALGICFLVAGAIVTVKKRHEGPAGLRAGAFLMATALVLGLSFNSFTKNDYQNYNPQETATVKVLNWYEGENQKAREIVTNWLVEFITD